MNKPPIIIGGCPRSGTTLLRTMLDSHPNIYSGPELAITMQACDSLISAWHKIGDRAQTSYGLEEEDFSIAYGKAIEHILERVRQKSGKARVADKMPQSIQHFTNLCWMLPESPLIHIIRDGRDVACSIVNYEVEFKDDKGEPMWFTKTYADASKYWGWITSRGMLMRDHPCGNRYYELFYEDLVRNPKKELSKFLDFIGEPWDDRVLKHFELEHNLEATHDEVLSLPNTKSVGRWKRDMSEQESSAVHREIEPLLQKLGYEV